jgi:hypothetical protein
MVLDVIVSESGYPGPSWPTSGGDSGYKVADDDTESSISDVFDGVGELPLWGELEREAERFLDRIFWVIRVCENGREFAGNGLEKSSTVVRMAVVISSRDV